MTIDRERLEQMRAYADEIREDLERRELEDPIIDDITAHREPPAIVYKDRDNAKVFNVPDNAPAPFDDFQIDIVATVIAELRAETQAAIDAALAPLRERIASIEGQLTVLMTLLGADASRSIEASEVIRKIKVAK